MLIHQETIERVRERANILDQFDGKLKRVGSEFVTKCPWHDDQRPSLTVSPRTNRAYCFVCAKGVDAIGWLQDREGLTFSDAVIRLAERYGIEIKAANDEDSERYKAEAAERAKLYQDCKTLEDQFHERIWDCGLALDYLVSERHLNYESIAQWGLGWNGSRIMFPLRDPQGRTVGFTGRAMGDVKPKYKNSQNSLIYQKSQMMYGLDKARESIIRTGEVIITEGQLDVIRCHQVGITNLVAVSGCILTKGMIESLVRTCKVRAITLTFDGDQAGIKAAERSLADLRDIVLQGELELKILSLPEGSDPADLAESMAERISRAPHWVQWWLEHEFERLDLNTPQGVQAGEAAVRKILQVLPDGALREYVRRECRTRLNSLPMISAAKIRTQKQIDSCHWAERRALRLYIHDPGSRPALTDIQYQSPILAEAWAILQVIEGAGCDPENLATVFTGLIMKADESLMDEMRPIVRPIPEVLRVIHANPVNELEGALTILESTCCQDSLADR